MKKLCLILSILMILTIASCTANDKNPDSDTSPGNNVPGNADDLNGTGTANDNNEVVGSNGDDGNNEILTGKAEGFGGEVTVNVTVNGDDIVSVEAMGENETQGIGSNAIEKLPDKIVQADSTDVEGVSGATYTSNAIKEAVNDALKSKR